jgi:DNA segregation ATPase FtsK/SpoIIIE, S-DNA-T family
MRFLTETWDRWFRKNEDSFVEPEATSGDRLDNMAREIRGSIFALVALFFFVALVSYLPLDTFQIQQNHYDQVHNLGGIVGALIGEALLGTVGAPGFSTVAIFAWMSALAFLGIPVMSHSQRIFGVLLLTIFSAAGLQIGFGTELPEASLIQGGWLGKFAGVWLQTFFNTTGALLLLGGASLLTLITTMRFSFTRTASVLWKSEAEELDDEQIDSSSLQAEEPQTGEILSAVSLNTASPEKPARKRRKKPTANTDGTDTDNTLAEALEGADEQSDGDSLQAPKVFEYQQLIPVSGSFSLPSTRLLKNAEGSVKKLTRSELRENGERLVEHLLSFQITGEVTAVTQGPVLTTYEYKPSAGIKLSKIAGLQDDLGIVMGTNQLRIIAPIPGKTVVGIEIPRPEAETIPLKDLLVEDGFYDKKLRLPIAIGKTTDGEPVFADLAAMPHLLVAGATGSGKSVFMNSLIISLLYRLSPQQMRMILVDPKMLEFAAFQGLPHLVTEVITDNRKAFNALNWAVWEMERRYALMAKANAKNIDSYNGRMRADDKIPYLVVVIDELADLMMSGGRDVEVAITRLAQKARAAGIHLVIATQRPSAEVITGLIKANIPSRISFKVPSAIDSRTVLDASGAQELIGRGDSLMIQPGIPMRRIHGTYLSEEELSRVVKYVKDGKNFSKLFIDFSGTPKDAA